MKTIRDKYHRWLLGLALVFGLLFMGGAGWAVDDVDGGQLWMRNGHEGDPEDGNETVSGGSGGSPFEGGPQLPSPNPTTSFLVVYYFSSFEMVFEITFEFGYPVFQMVSPPQRGEK